MIGDSMAQIKKPGPAAETFRFQAELLAAVGQAIVVVDLDRTVIYWNRAAEAMYGIVGVGDQHSVVRLRRSARCGHGCRNRLDRAQHR